MSILDKDSMTEDHWSNNPRFKETSMTAEDEEFNRIEREAKQSTQYETKVYKTGGVMLDGRFYTVDELRQIIESIDNMSTILVNRK
jgi:hypothetical protein